MGFDTELFQDSQEELTRLGITCAFCLGVWEKPTLVCPNSHILCADCIDQWSRVRGLGGTIGCPECRENVMQERIVVRQLETTILGKQVQCPNRSSSRRNNNSSEEEEDSEPPQQRPRLEETTDQDCQWTGSLRDYVENHKEECEFRRTACPHCDQEVISRDLEDHTSRLCQYRTISCNLCNVELTPASLPEHQAQHCPEREIACPWGCEARFLRRNLGQIVETSYTGHAEVCPLVPIPCTFTKYGCNERIPRNQMEDHNQSNHHRHLLLMMQKLDSLESTLQAERTRQAEEASWQKVSFAWSIPSPKIQGIRHAPPRDSPFIRRLRSFPQTVGEFTVFVVLEINEFSHHLRFQVHVQEPRGFVMVQNILMQEIGRDVYHELENAIQVERTEHPRGLSPATPSVDLPVLIPRSDGEEGDGLLRPCKVSDLVQRTESLRLRVSFRLKYNERANDVGTV